MLMPERQQLRQRWLQQVFNHEHFTETPASADASFRSYYRVRVGERSYIVMDAPPKHEDCRPFIDVTRRLLACDVNVPQIHGWAYNYCRLGRIAGTNLDAYEWLE